MPSTRGRRTLLIAAGLVGPVLLVGCDGLTGTHKPTRSAGVGAPSRKPFTIGGYLDRRLSPGTTGRLDLVLSNPGPHQLRVQGLLVTVVRTSRVSCPVRGDFATRQFTGRYPLTVAPRSTRSLSQLGVPAARWPQVSMVDLPVNQDSCQNVTLTLAYTGSGTAQ